MKNKIIESMDITEDVELITELITYTIICTSPFAVMVWFDMASFS